MIKRYIQFVNEKYEYEGEQPGPNEPGCVKIEVESIDEFAEDPALSKLVSDGKVALYNGEVWYHQSDIKTAELLNQYFGDQMQKDPIGWDEENESKRSKINESWPMTETPEDAEYMASNKEYIDTLSRTRSLLIDVKTIVGNAYANARPDNTQEDEPSDEDKESMIDQLDELNGYLLNFIENNDR